MFTTSSGVVLTIQAIDRRVLDAFQLQHPLPVPPTKEVTLYGGFKDTIEDVDDPEYLHALTVYRLALATDQIAALLPGIQVVGEYADYPLYGELVDIGIITPDNKLDFINHVALTSDTDIDAVVGEVLYLSTTTERGITEARTLFSATWYSLPLENVKTKHTPAGFSRYYEDREAARFGFYNWDAFCALPGPEQSAVVAHFRTARTLEYHNANWRTNK